jgi:nuclear transport factor 2 (NTF2) superfamily protein
MRRHVTAQTIVVVSTTGDRTEYPLPLMPNQPVPEIELLRAAYVAFNARDIDKALVLMTPDVSWPRAFKGGFVRGTEQIRAYWTEQWSEIDGQVEPVAFYPEDAGQILVKVHQVVRDLAGAVLADEHVGHRFTIEQGLIKAMEVCSLPASDSGA